MYEGKKDVKEVIDFIEKPKLSLADKLVKEGKCFWNVGVFILNSETWINAIKKLINLFITTLVGLGRTRLSTISSYVLANRII